MAKAKGEFPSRCSAPQDCKNCKAYVDRSYWKNTPNGGWVEEWEECAFGHIKATEEDYERLKESIKDPKNQIY